MHILRLSQLNIFHATVRTDTTRAHRKQLSEATNVSTNSMLNHIPTRRFDNATT
jgi:hypothetical protein